MTTYADVVYRLDRIIAGVETQVEDELKHDAICAALDAILPWHGKRSIQDISGDGELSSFDLASDLYEIDAVQLNSTGEFLPSAMLSSGLFRGDNSAGGNDWIEYPSGVLSLSKVLGSADSLTVYYRAHWDKPTSKDDTTFVFTTPEYLDKPLIYYASAYCISPQAITTATVRQYATKIDSGTPIHNPLADSAVFLLRLFHDLMNSYPKQITGSSL